MAKAPVAMSAATALADKAFFTAIIVGLHKVPVVNVGNIVRFPAHAGTSDVPSLGTVEAIAVPASMGGRSDPQPSIGHSAKISGLKIPGNNRERGELTAGHIRRRIFMSTLLIIILLVVLLGGGGFGYSRWGYGGVGGVLGLVLVVFLVLWLLGAVGHA